jgi:hypothetical protein
MCTVPSAPGRPASESGTLCHVDGAEGRGGRRRRVLMLPAVINLSCAQDSVVMLL